MAAELQGGASAGVGALLRAALPSVPGVNLLPGVRKTGATGDPDLVATGPAVLVDRAQVAAYAAVCGFPAKETLPLTYPHVLALPLHLALMAHPAFPFPAVGTVHLENAVTSHRPVYVGETLRASVRTGPIQRHPRGTAVDLVAQVRSGEDLVWESTSTYLRRGRQPDGGAEHVPLLPEDLAEQSGGAGIEWRLPGDSGRRYAAVSGDHNPIHLHPLTAKAFGFPRPITDRMWTKARCVAAVENRLPEAVRVEVAFRKPVLLPGSVRFRVRGTGDGAHTFALTRPSDGSLHLVGRATPL